METRELFWSLSPAAKAGFYLIGWTAIALSLAGILWHVAKYRRGQPLPIAVDLADGVRRMVKALLTHRTIKRRDRYAGAAHGALFFGFVLLFIGTVTITVDYDITRPLLHYSFWKGWFFLWFSLTLDLAGFFAIAGLGALMVRRAFFGLAKLDYRRAYRGEAALRPVARRWRSEDWLFLAALLFILVSGFLQEAVRHATEHPVWAWWEPIGELIARGLLVAGMQERGLEHLRAANWWIHGLAALVFIAALPWYKAKHMLTAMASLAARDPKTLARLPRPKSTDATVGVATLADFSWKDLVDLDACTKCGRCHDVCPARIVGAPLSPRDLILDLRVAAESAGRGSLAAIPVVGGVIAPDTLWSCRSCGACQEICPVGVEHPVKIVQMRRQLVERRMMDPLLEQTLVAIGNTGNSFGENSRKRSAWTRELPFPIKDIRRESADYLWFVGDYASFDPRNQKVSRTVAGLLRVVGLDFGLLHEGERTAGNDVRRVGEEGLYESLTEHNLAQFGAAQPFRRILTTDPHSFNTIRNEYPEFGQTPPIAHYTELLRELLESGRLRVRRPLKLRVTFHDPCHLGRLNRRYDDPRRVLELIGCTLIEMPRNRSQSFCCGAGGGRIWMADPPGKKKPSELRVEEAASIGPIDVFVTCCPKDLTMFEDARKTAGLEQAFVVEDIAELVARAVELGTLTLHDVPSLVERISATVVERIGAQLEEKLKGIGELRAVPASGSGAALPVAETARDASHAAAAPAQTWRIRPLTPAIFPGYVAPVKNGRRFLVAVKHVAKLSDDFRVADGARDIASDYFDYQLNEFDDVALEQALKTAESFRDSEVVVVTVGSAGAEDTLRKALAKGAHRGLRIESGTLGFADPLAVARLLAGIVVAEQPELVFCGVQSSDQANAATGSALARLVGYACAAVAVATEWDGGGMMCVTRELEGGLRHEINVPVPAVITMQAGANIPRYATMRMQKDAKTKPVVDVTPEAADLAPVGGDVGTIALPSVKRATILAGNPDDTAREVLNLVRKHIGGHS